MHSEPYFPERDFQRAYLSPDDVTDDTDKLIIGELKDGNCIAGGYAIHFLTKYLKALGYSDTAIPYNDVDLYHPILPQPKLDAPSHGWHDWAASVRGMRAVTRYVSSVRFQDIYENPAASILVPVMNRIAESPPVIKSTIELYNLDATPNEYRRPTPILGAYDLTICQAAVRVDPRSEELELTYTNGFEDSLMMQHLMPTRRHMELMQFIRETDDVEMILHGGITAKRLHKYMNKLNFSVDPSLLDVSRTILERALNNHYMHSTKSVEAASNHYVGTSYVHEDTLKFFQLEQFIPVDTVEEEVSDVASSSI